MWLELLLGLALLFAWLYRYVTKQFGEFSKRGMPFAKPSFPFGSSNAKKLFSGKLSFFDLEKDLAESDEFKSEKVFGYFMMGQPTVVINDEELAMLERWERELRRTVPPHTPIIPDQVPLVAALLRGRPPCGWRAGKTARA